MEDKLIVRQNATSNSSMLQTRSISRSVKLSCKAIEWEAARGVKGEERTKGLIEVEYVGIGRKRRQSCRGGRRSRRNYIGKRKKKNKKDKNKWEKMHTFPFRYVLHYPAVITT